MAGHGGTQETPRGRTSGKLSGTGSISIWTFHSMMTSPSTLGQTLKDGSSTLGRDDYKSLLAREGRIVSVTPPTLCSSIRPQQ